MKLKLLLAFVALGLSIVSAKSYSVTLFEPSLIGGAELKPGAYKLEVQNDKVVIGNGKVSGEAKVTVETGDAKYPATTVRYRNGDGKYRIQEIRLGGTNMKLEIND